MNIFQIVSVACIGSILAILLKSYRPEISIGITIITGILLLYICVEGIGQVFGEFQGIIEKSGVDIRYFEVILKVIGIAYISQFGAEICRDGGQGSIALKLELAGKVFIMILTMPIIQGFLDLIMEILR